MCTFFFTDPPFPPPSCCASSKPFFTLTVKTWLDDPKFIQACDGHTYAMHNRRLSSLRLVPIDHICTTTSEPEGTTKQSANLIPDFLYDMGSYWIQVCVCVWMSMVRGMDVLRSMINAVWWKSVLHWTCQCSSSVIT